MAKESQPMIRSDAQGKNWAKKTNATRDNNETTSSRVSRSGSTIYSQQSYPTSGASQRAQEIERRRQDAMRREAEAAKRNEENRRALLESERKKREESVGAES